MSVQGDRRVSTGPRSACGAADVVRVLGGAAAVAVLCGCSTISGALGDNKSAPDEFRVVTKAPLVVPPEYALRPPAPGEPRPQELQPESQARLALLGSREAVTRDAAEKAFADKAGAEKADPLIRYVMDDEFGEIAHKDKSFADRVMFWRKGDPEVGQVASAADTPAPLDPTTVRRAVKALTGDGAVVIKREPEKRGIKLPGL